MILNLIDNSKHELDNRYNDVSTVFQNGAVIDIDKNIFLKICDFVNYYINLDNNTKKALDYPDKLIDTNTDIYSWLDKYTDVEPTLLLEIINSSARLKIKSLHEFACYKLAKTLNTLDIAKIREIFGYKK